MNTAVATGNTGLVRTLLCFAVFEAAWFACVSGAAHGAMGWGIAAVIFSIGLQLAFSGKPGIDLLLIAASLGCGLAWDTTLSHAQVVVYSSHVPTTVIAPVWILALWAQLGSVLRVQLRWLHERPWIAAVLGGVGGAASYAGATRMGACAFPEPVTALCVLAVGWGVILPSLLRLARRMDRDR